MSDIFLNKSAPKSHDGPKDVGEAPYTSAEKAWLNLYHARVVETVGPALDAATRAWLVEACAPLV